MTKQTLPLFELRPPETKIIRVWLCRDGDGNVAVWLGKRAGIKLDNSSPPFWIGDFDQWLEVQEEDGYSEADWSSKTFCKDWDCKVSELPEPGKCQYVRIKVPK